MTLPESTSVEAVAPLSIRDEIALRILAGFAAHYGADNYLFDGASIDALKIADEFLKQREGAK